MVSVPPRDMVCLSTHYWGDAWFRKQHFMQRFAERGHRVLYVEPSHSMVRAGPEPSVGSNGLVFSRLRRESRNLWILAPAQLFPKPQQRLVSEFNHRRTVLAARRAARRIGFCDPVLWVYEPEFAPWIHLLPHSKLVFDLVDDLVGYERVARGRERVAGCMGILLRHADRTVFTSAVLQQKYGDATPSRIIPNGYDGELFRPDGFKGRSRTRRVGFVGTLFGFLDYGLLERIAREIPDVTLVLVGRLEGTESRVERLFKLANVEYCGYVERRHIPALISGFDVCVAPFTVDTVSASVSPLKVYEYLAMHRPVVCTRMDGLEREPIAEFVDFASSGDDFIAGIRERLVSWPVDRGALAEALQSCTWDSRFAALERFLGGDVLGPEPFKAQT